MEKQRADGADLPRSLKAFLRYYWRIDPRTWLLFLLQDIVHFSRYPLAFVLVGMVVDRLRVAPPVYGIPTETLWMAAGIFAVLGIGEASHVWTAYIVRRWKPRLRARIRRDFFNYALGHSHSFFQDNFAGSLARKVTEVAESSWRLHDHLRFSIFGPIVSMTAATITLFLVSPWYGAGLLFFIATVTLPVMIRLKKISGRARDFSEIRAGVTGTIVDTLTNAASMRAFARAGHERDLHDETTRREEKADSDRLLTLIQIESWRRLSLVLLGGGMMVALLFGWQARIVSIGEISAVMGLSFSLIGSVWMFGWGIIMTTDELGYIDDAIRMLTPPHAIRDRADAAPLAIARGAIAFRNVTFVFPGRPVFENLSLTIPAGQKVGLVGASGAGKSTLLSLLLRLYEIEKGRIAIDGVDIAGVTQESLRTNIAVIPQDTALFHRTLIDNIRYGRLGATDEEIVAAAKKAHAHDFIMEMPEGYQTMVGERGVKLSGGQRQRVAIARAILKDAPILMLDEATSALDSESEGLIQESLAGLMQGRTVIAIAHRLSTIASMDRLLVMDRGRIIEDGSHAELIALNGTYARLWALQSGGFVGERGIPLHT